MERIKKFLKASGGMGLRIVKTGIAATLCVVVSYWMMLDTPFCGGCYGHLHGKIH